MSIFFERKEANDTVIGHHNSVNHNYEIGYITRGIMLTNVTILQDVVSILRAKPYILAVWLT